MKFTGVYIPEIDAKDLYLSNNIIGARNSEYKIRKNGKLNYNRFINTLDYSLDLIKLREIYDEIYDEEYRAAHPMSEFDSSKEYTDQVINVTFKYSVKEFNQNGKNVFVKNGYDARKLKYNDGIAECNGEIVGVETDKDVERTTLPLPKYIKYISHDENDKFSKGHYEIGGGVPVLMTRAELRHWIYTNGFRCDGIHYVRFKRSAGSARRGVCNFINEKLYPKFDEYDRCGLDIKDGQKINLASWEAYISLTASSIIDTLEIKPENILLIDDYESTFQDRVMLTSSVNDHLVTEPKTIDVTNSIWDGQSLIDKSLLGKYAEHGMVLLRNRFFKSCCFNTNIQQWFKDNGITDVSQLHGKTIATKIEDIKLITCPTSIKYVKFGTFEQWLKCLSPTFGVVKYDHLTKYFDGDLVQIHYQLLNSLQLSYNDVKELLKPSLEYILALRDDPAVLRYHIKFGGYKNGGIVGSKNKNDIIYALMNLNDSFTKTKIYADFVRALVKSQFDNLKLGHVLVNGNYSTLCGNPIEMLQSAIGRFDGKSQIGVGNIHLTRFDYDRPLIASRSPHVASGNIWVPMNTANEMIDKYMNTTPQICYMNSIGENVLFRLSGSDFDSDCALFSDNEVLIRAAKKNYHNFLVPTGAVAAEKIERYYTNEQKADLDIKTSVNKIGEIINFSQILNSVMWDNIAHGDTFEDNIEIYKDIAQLDTMSNLEIDSAKKVFCVNNVTELKNLKNKYDLRDDLGKDIRPKFFMHVAKKKGYYIKGAKDYKVHMTTMDYVQDVVNRTVYAANKYNALGNERLSTVLDDSKYDNSEVSYAQIDKIEEIVKNLKSARSAIYLDHNIDTEEKEILNDRLTYNTIYEISKFKINYNTAYAIMNRLDRSKQIADIRQTLFYLLLSLPSTMFFDVFDKSKKNIVYLIMQNDGSDYDCEFYSHKFKHVFVDGSEYKKIDESDISKRVDIDDILNKMQFNSKKR